MHSTVSFKKDILPIEYISQRKSNQFYPMASSAEHSYSVFNDYYFQGVRDGAAEKEAELEKMARVLFNLAYEKATTITKKLIECAEENSITIYEFHLKLEGWDKMNLLVIVNIDDYTNEKIEKLYECATNLTIEYNTSDFNCEYAITYFSNSINKERIYTDGFTLKYEHSPITC